MSPAWALLAGVACAGVGGELFVRGAVGVAHWARVAPGIIAATVVAFATSSPELSVSVNAALAGDPQVALGDALGSNVVNVALILGLALSIAAIHSSRGSVRRDFPVALLAPLATAVLCLDGLLSRAEGVFLLGCFGAWLALSMRAARRTRVPVSAVAGGPRRGPVVLACLLGLALLVAAGRLIVMGAVDLASRFEVDPFIVGATVVAVGTSVPELATTLVAKLRGHDDISLGAVLGSNIFNSLFIVGVAATIHPISVAFRDVALALGVGIAVLVVAYPGRSGTMARWRGPALLLLYAAYVWAMVGGHTR